MGLIINSTEKKRIFIQGTKIELKNVYARLEFSARENGTTLETAINIYESKDAFKKGQNTLFTDLQRGSQIVELKIDEKQNLESAEFYTKLQFEELGYNVEFETVTVQIEAMQKSYLSDFEAIAKEQ